MIAARFLIIAACSLSAGFGVANAQEELLDPGAQVREVSGGFTFTEGPAADQEGNVYFTDIPNNRIHVWTVDGELATFRENSNGTNGLFFDREWRLHGVEGSGNRVVRMDEQGNAIPLVEEFDGKPFNSPNDLWIDDQGGIYFTDPNYGPASGMSQDGEHVYYLPAGAEEAKVIITDLVRPNGIIGTRDGSTLYVADHMGNMTYAYSISGPGEISGKREFAPQGSDGVTLDEHGNLYLTGAGISVYNPDGELIETIEVPQAPANMTFGGPDRNILYITARSSLYAIPMNVRGMY